MPSNNTFLWQLSHSSNPGLSFLFGTMHVRDQQAFGNVEIVKEKIKQCDSFALEFDLESRDSLRGVAVPQADLPDICDIISQKKYDNLCKVILKATGVDITYMRNMPPFLLIGMITERVLGKEMPVSLDQYLWQFAKKEGKELLGVETFREQLAVLDSIPYELQVKMLLDLGRNISKIRANTYHLANLYNQGKMLLLSKCVKESSKGLRKILLYKRNEIMAERIFRMANEKTIVAAVGAGHLGGGKGVIRLLKKRGMKVKPVHQSVNENESPNPK